MVAETEEEELARLIREQEQDMQRGNYQPPEHPGIVPLSQIPNWEDRVSAEDGFPWKVEVDEEYSGCNIHGPVDMRQAPPSWQKRGIQFRCYACKREADRRFRQLHKPWRQRDN